MDGRTQQLTKIAAEMRGKIITLSHNKKSAHLGSCLSCVDILTALYWNTLQIDPEHPDDISRDRFIFSKGHAAMALYVALAMRGYFPEEDLDNFAKPGSGLAEHPLHGGVPGLEIAAGSLGHGLGLGLGMALAARIQKRHYRVFALLSDGECNEGSVWEAAMFASAQGLDNLAVIVDFNKWQATGRSCDVMALDPLVDKWTAFGWCAKEIDGHNIAALTDALATVPEGSGKPLAIIAHTIKGKGVSFMEDDNNWHYRIPTADEVSISFKELGLK